ncbi:MAG: class A beta-lactamase-related serine hydrolase [Pedobacter sp.]|nr:MAG: class A beta-lactamase-related serine hydrolase [Pedobacter sp.]
MKKLASIFLLFLFGIWNSVWAQYYKLDSLIQVAMEDTQTVGLSLAVIKNNQLHYIKTYGYKNLETKEKLDPEDMFRIASISKSFTATAIMQFVDTKKINLSDDISDLMGFRIRNPKYPEQVITLKMLLSHTSSINDKEGYFTLEAIHPNYNPNWANAYNDYAPGSTYQYCNLNFNILGTLLEKLSGERFDNYIPQQILKPLGISGGYRVDALDPTKLVTLYEYNSSTKSYKPAEAAYAKRAEEIKNYKLGWSTPIFSPTGGMKITAKDLALYMKMHMNYGKSNGIRIISKKSSKLMQTPVSLPDYYGLALQETRKLIPGITLVGHTGSAYGLFSTMFFNPKKGYGIVLITNGTNGGYDQGYNKILKQGFELVYQEILK